MCDPTSSLSMLGIPITAIVVLPIIITLIVWRIRAEWMEDTIT